VCWIPRRISFHQFELPMPHGGISFVFPDNRGIVDWRVFSLQHMKHTSSLQRRNRLATMAHGVLSGRYVNDGRHDVLKESVLVGKASLETLVDSPWPMDDQWGADSAFVRPVFIGPERRGRCICP